MLVLRSVALLALFLMGCGSPFKKFVIDPNFKQHIQKWNKIYPKNIANYISVEFTDELEAGELGETAGECFTDSDGPKILISKKLWDTFDDRLREELIFHELGHCVMGLGHNCSRKLGGLPSSIMYPVMFSIPEKDVEYYYEELPESQSNC